MKFIPNSILERVHQTIGNIIITFMVQDMAHKDMNPWDGIPESTIFALCATTAIQRTKT